MSDFARAQPALRSARGAGARRGRADARRADATATTTRTERDDAYACVATPGQPGRLIRHCRGGMCEDKTFYLCNKKQTRTDGGTAHASRHACCVDAAQDGSAEGPSRVTRGSPK